MDRINGNFSNLKTVVSCDDLVYFIKANSITKLSLNTGILTTKELPSKVI